jgi:hypothetical protein
MKARDDAKIVLGASPRISLLPPEVRQRKRDQRTRRNAVALVALALVVSALASAGARLYSINESAALVAAQSQTTMLLEQQKAFSEVRTTMTALRTAQQARVLGGSTDIDWRAWHATAASTLPGGAHVISLVIDSGTPIEIFPSATVPLQGARIGEIIYQVGTVSLADVQRWVDSLNPLPGFVDATPTSVALDPASGEYVSTVVIHINEAAYSLQFEPGEGS